jgi:filamentous hemagglutinin
MTAKGGVLSMLGASVDGDIVATRSMILADGTTTSVANRNVTLQAWTDQLQ